MGESGLGEYREIVGRCENSDAGGCAVSWLPGVHVAPNIQDGPALYEIENRALDPEGLLLAGVLAGVLD